MKENYATYLSQSMDALASFYASKNRSYEFCSNTLSAVLSDGTPVRWCFNSGDCSVMMTVATDLTGTDEAFRTALPDINATLQLGQFVWESDHLCYQLRCALAEQPMTALSCRLLEHMTEKALETGLPRLRTALEDGMELHLTQADFERMFANLSAMS